MPFEPLKTSQHSKLQPQVSVQPLLAVPQPAAKCKIPTRVNLVHAYISTRDGNVWILFEQYLWEQEPQECVIKIKEKESERKMNEESGDTETKNQKKERKEEKMAKLRKVNEK